MLPLPILSLSARRPATGMVRASASPAGNSTNPDFEGLRDLFTVDLISRYIQAKVAPSKN